MEVYILDDQLRRVEVVDRFESMIWSERYSAWGDFELYLQSTPAVRGRLTTGIRLAMNESYRVMVIESTEGVVDGDGKHMYRAKGRSLEAILEDRVARNTFASLDTTPKWILTGTPANIARQIFDEICRTNVNFAEDQITFLTAGSIFPASTIAEPAASITIELDISTVYDAIKDLCEAYDLGFRLVRNFDTSELYFDIYSGDDRTTQQTTLAPVLFSQSMDNLGGVKTLKDVSDVKNVAYVYHALSTQIVIAEGTDTEVEGFQRRVMPVDATDIEIPERPYSWTTAQEDAMNKFLGLSNPADDRKESMRNLLNKERLTQTDYDNIGISSNNTSLTTAEQTAILEARTISWDYNTTEINELNVKMQDRGKQELAKHRGTNALEGEVPTSSIYKYGVAYNLGDLVDLRDQDGVTSQMRVTEQIFTSDSEGDKSYPTLTTSKFITPDSWLGWSPTEVWENAGTTEWATAGE